MLIQSTLLSFMQQIDVAFNSATTTFCFNATPDSLVEWGRPGKTFIITDSHIMATHKQRFLGWPVIEIPPGEQSKSLAVLEHIINRLLELGADRDALLIGIGGGVVTDITGFVAGIYKRGVSFGFVPTSVLAMVDAAIGGKNGLDMGDFKNMIGLIRQPRFLLYDYNFLDSLPREEWINGFAEIVKHAAIADKDMLLLLAGKRIEAFQDDPGLLNQLIQRNALFKSGVVQRDEWEKGERKLLNFGHTLGHAIENRYNLPHGHAISIGMAAACRMSERLLGFEETRFVTDVLQQYHLPVQLEFDKDEALATMMTDKKKEGDQIIYILLRQLGEAVLQPLSLQEIKQSL